MTKGVNSKDPSMHGCMDGFETKDVGKWSYLHMPALTESGILHGFFTRQSPSTERAGEDMKEFLRLSSLDEAVVLHQEHGDIFHLIKEGFRPASGDGIIVMEEGIAGIIKTADCLPLILADPLVPVAAVVHAGWRGTAKRIGAKVARAMMTLGARRERITALLGPSIGPCCYVVKGDVADVFESEAFPASIFVEREGSLFLDLRAANRVQLQEEGVEQIYDAGLCTYCRPETFASYRRGEKEARQANFVSVRHKV